MTDVSSIPGFIPHAVAAPYQRSLLSIVWSCLATLFACAWVAVHPDTPSSVVDDNNKTFRHFFHRVKLLVWVLISPEAILVWAWRQRRGARSLQYRFNTSSDSQVYLQYWSLTHAHFLQMGGFVFCTKENGGQKKSVACPEQFHEFAKHNKELLDEIKQSEIEDRSKGDGFTYFVAITQLAWFNIQCVGRANAGLSITLFELVSISFVPISIIMYILWWQKPQNAQSPIILQRNSGRNSQTTTPQQEPTEDPNPSGSSDDSCSELDVSKESLPFPISLLQTAIRIFEDMLGTTSRSQHCVAQEGGRHRLPSFYAYTHNNKYNEIPRVPLIIGSLFGSIFGIVHIIGWGFNFTTRFEKVLWRSSASVIVVIPLLTVAVILTARKLLHVNKLEQTPIFREYVFPVLQVLYPLLAGILALSYIAARIILLVVMCTSLRALAASELQDITWVTDIPHIL